MLNKSIGNCRSVCLTIVFALSLNVGSLQTVSADPCLNPPENLVGWWRAENNGLDSGGNNHAALLNNATFASGRVGQAFSFDGTNAGVRIPYSPALDVGGSQEGFTVEGWINPSTVSVRAPIAEWNSGSQWGVHFHIDPDSWDVGPGSLYANIFEDGGGWKQLQSGPGVITPNEMLR